MRVLFTFRPNHTLRNRFREELGSECRLIFPADTEPETLRKHIRSAEVVVGWRADEDLVAAARRVRLWQNPGVGVTHLISLFRDRPEITLANSHGNTYFTAQHAVALLLVLTNQIHLHHDWLRRGRWRTGDDEAASAPLRDRRVGVLGYGHVGRKIARFLSGFDVSLSAYKNRPTDANGRVPGVRCWYRSHGDSLRQFVRRTDVLMITLPLTDRTEGLIDADLLRELGEDGLLVNVGRGAVIIEDDLYRALRDGVIRGAALDVWWCERDPVQFPDGGMRPHRRPFHQLDNVVMSPHRAASPFDDLARWDDVIENIRRAVRGRNDFLNVVDTGRGY